MFYPTETVYGLGCDARNKKALRRIYILKGRPRGKPFIVLVRDIKMAKQIGRFSLMAEKVVQRAWPGPLTLVLPLKRGVLPRQFFKETIALRVSSHPFVRSLFRHIDYPLVSTSANVSGKPATRSPEEFKRQLGAKIKKIDIIINAGILPRSKPSTVVDFTGKEPRLLRKGAVLWPIKGLKN
jgi:L-threonylcarbamoyladenylate synthase